MARAIVCSRRRRRMYARLQSLVARVCLHIPSVDLRQHVVHGWRAFLGVSPHWGYPQILLKRLGTTGRRTVASPSPVSVGRTCSFRC